MHQVFQDAMALVTEIGKPTYFITMTANPQWQEIQDKLKPWQKAEDVPTLVARVFHIKFQQFLEDVTVKERLGKCLSYVYTIEFQKRGLPHAHLILIMDTRSLPRTGLEIDCVVSAEIPDITTSPKLHDTVLKYMVHGPCSTGRCLSERGCRFKFPKPPQPVTIMAEDAYPAYKRTEDGPTLKKGGRVVTNAWIVPYTPYFLLKYNCHVNTEVATGIQAVGYLCKYIAKGHDRVAVELFQGDEPRAYVDGRYLSAAEGEFRLQVFTQR